MQNLKTLEAAASIEIDDKLAQIIRSQHEWAEGAEETRSHFHWRRVGSRLACLHMAFYLHNLPVVFIPELLYISLLAHTLLLFMEIFMHK
jgi:hypothetical protein